MEITTTLARANRGPFRFVRAGVRTPPGNGVAAWFPGRGCGTLARYAKTTTRQPTMASAAANHLFNVSLRAAAAVSVQGRIGGGGHAANVEPAAEESLDPPRDVLRTGKCLAIVDH